MVSFFARLSPAGSATSLVNSWSDKELANENWSVTS
jgi:hypothetical protein